MKFLDSVFTVQTLLDPTIGAVTPISFRLSASKFKEGVSTGPLILALRSFRSSSYSVEEGNEEKDEGSYTRFGSMMYTPQGEQGDKVVPISFSSE